MEKTIERVKERFDKKIEIEFSDRQKINSIEIWQFWRYYEGMNIGNEISKDLPFKRVWLVLNNNIWNDLISIAPITTKYHKSQSKYYVEIDNYEKYKIKKWRAIINQIKLIDKKRFAWKATEIKSSIKLVNYIKNKINQLMFWN